MSKLVGRSCSDDEPRHRLADWRTERRGTVAGQQRCVGPPLLWMRGVCVEGDIRAKMADWSAVVPCPRGGLMATGRDSSTSRDAGLPSIIVYDQERLGHQRWA